MIASRLLKLRSMAGEISIPVRIFAPERDEKAWSCRYEIHWPDGTRQSAALGADSVQAFLFALQMIGAELYTSDHHKSGNLIWDEPGNGYGFPLTQNLRDLLTGDDAKFL